MTPGALCSVSSQRDPDLSGEFRSNCCHPLAQTLTLKQHTVLLRKTASCFLELIILVLSSSQSWCSCQRLDISCFVLPVQACSSLEPTEASVLIRIVYLQFKQYLHKQQHPTCLSCSCMYISDCRPFVYVTIVQWGKIAYKSLFGFIS